MEHLKKNCDDLNLLYQKPLGKYLSRLETKILNEFAKKISGDNLIQIGGINNIDYKKLFKVKTQFYIPSLLELKNLHINPHSINIVVLFQPIDSVMDLEKFITYINKILTLDGKLIVFGFNPHGITGLSYLFKRARGLKASLPFAKFSQSIKNFNIYLSCSGFTKIITKTFGFNIFSDFNKKPKYAFKEYILRRLFPTFGSFYCISAEKKPPVITLQKSHSKILNNLISTPPRMANQTNNLITTAVNKNE